MGNIGLEDCPSDIHLEILTHLDLSDVLSFLSVCPSLHKLVDMPALWMGVLEGTESHRPLACPLGTDLSRLELHELRHVARHTNRVEQNWNNDHPRVLHTTELDLPDEWEVNDISILAVIPAASMIIIHTWGLGGELLVLCSFQSVAISEPFCAMNTLCDYAHTNETGRLLFACTFQPLGLFDEVRRDLCIFSITYGSGCTKLGVDIVYHTSLDYSYRTGLFISEDVVGYVRDESGRLFIRALNYVTKTSVDIPLDSASSINEISIIVTSSAPFIMEECYSGRYRIHRCPSELLPYCRPMAGEDFTQPRGVEKLGHIDPSYMYHYPADDSSCQLSPSLTAKHVVWSPRGVHRFLYGDYISPLTHQSQRPLTTVYFWPANYDSSSNSEGDMYNNTRVARVELRRAYGLQAVSVSGTYAVLSPCHGSLTSEHDLHLLQFCDNPTRIEVRPIVLPSVSLSHISSIAIDERHGVIYISQRAAKLIAVRFA